MSAAVARVDEPQEGVMSAYAQSMVLGSARAVIASVQGHALGGCCELAMFCDITIAAENAIFGEPEIHFSNVGPAIVMPWMIGFKKARELLYLGDMIDAETALQLGMIHLIRPLAVLHDRTLRFAKRMALISTEALAQTKLAINSR